MANNTTYETALARHQALIRESVEIYCRWLNQYMETDQGNDFRYTPANFLDKAVNPHANMFVDVVQDDEERTYLVLTPCDGDDGGPATLYIYADRNWHSEATGRMVTSSHPTFDGTTTKEVEYTYPETRTVLEESYALRFILQEFDTMFSPVYNGDPVKLYNNND